MWAIGEFGLLFILFSVSSSCPMICFYQPTDGVADCVLDRHSVPDNGRILACSIGNYFGTSILNLGSREILNRFEPNSIESLKLSVSKYQGLYINATVGLINSRSFNGYFSNLKSVGFYSVGNVTTNAFSEMPYLKELDFNNNSKMKVSHDCFIVDSTNLQRKMFVRLNAKCYSCPKSPSSSSSSSERDVIYFQIQKSTGESRSLIYTNVKLSSCLERYTEKVCSESSQKSENLTSYYSNQMTFWSLIFISSFTFIMVIILLFVLFYIKRIYRRDIKYLKSKYIADIMNGEKRENLKSQLLA